MISIPRCSTVYDAGVHGDRPGSRTTKPDSRTTKPDSRTVTPHSKPGSSTTKPGSRTIYHSSHITKPGSNTVKPGYSTATPPLPDVVNVGKRQPFVLTSKPATPQSSKTTPKTTPTRKVPVMRVLSHELLDTDDEDHTHNMCVDDTSLPSPTKNATIVVGSVIVAEKDEAVEYM